MHRRRRESKVGSKQWTVKTKRGTARHKKNVDRAAPPPKVCSMVGQRRKHHSESITSTVTTNKDESSDITPSHSDGSSRPHTASSQNSGNCSEENYDDDFKVCFVLALLCASIEV